MGVLFDYTQAEEAEPEMRCLGAVSEIKWLLIHMEAWTNSLMQGLLRTVCVRLTFAQSYTTLIYTVGAFLFFFLCMCVCALLNCVPYLTSARGRVTLFYLPNHSVSLLDFEFRCALITTATQATTEVATLTDKILHAEIDRLLNFTSVERELFEPLQLYEDLGAHR